LVQALITIFLPAQLEGKLELAGVVRGVGWPRCNGAGQGIAKLVTAAMLVRLRRLKASAITSILKRSPRGMRRENAHIHLEKLGV